MVASLKAKEASMFNITKSDLQRKSSNQLPALFQLATFQSSQQSKDGRQASRLLALIRCEQARRATEPQP
jgi:hypothetical protein